MASGRVKVRASVRLNARHFFIYHDSTRFNLDQFLKKIEDATRKFKCELVEIDILEF